VRLITQQLTIELRKPSAGMFCHVAVVRTHVSEEHITSIIRVTRISELGTMLAVTGNQSTLQRSTLQEPHPITFQKAAFFIVTAVKTSNLT
jgi:hypothetical protein